MSPGRPHTSNAVGQVGQPDASQAHAQRPSTLLRAEGGEGQGHQRRPCLGRHWAPTPASPRWTRAGWDSRAEWSPPADATDWTTDVLSARPGRRRRRGPAKPPTRRRLPPSTRTSSALSARWRSRDAWTSSIRRQAPARPGPPAAHDVLPTDGGDVNVGAATGAYILKTGERRLEGPDPVTTWSLWTTSAPPRTWRLGGSGSRNTARRLVWYWLVKRLLSGRTPSSDGAPHAGGGLVPPLLRLPPPDLWGAGTLLPAHPRQKRLQRRGTWRHTTHHCALCHRQGTPVRGAGRLLRPTRRREALHLFHDRGRPRLTSEEQSRAAGCIINFSSRLSRPVSCSYAGITSRHLHLNARCERSLQIGTTASASLMLCCCYHVPVLDALTHVPSVESACKSGHLRLPDLRLATRRLEPRQLRLSVDTWFRTSLNARQLRLSVPFSHFALLVAAHALDQFRTPDG